MIIPIFILTALRDIPKAADFFPLQPGLTRYYEIKGQPGQLVTVVGDKLDQGGVTVTPITEKSDGRNGAKTYYRVDTDQVAIVAYDVKHPLTVPLPILRTGESKVSWDYSGKTMVGTEGERLLAHGESKLVGQREVLGHRVDVLEVKLLAQIGVGMSSMTFDQKALYAKGIGLFEWTSKTTLGNNKKRSEQASYKLVSVEEPKSGN